MGNNHGGRFSDGFLLGALVGGLTVFLLGTNKGKKLLKAITDEGFEGLGEIAKDLENEAKKETKVQLNKLEDKIEDIGESIVAESSNGSGHKEVIKSPAKRFFRKPAKN